MRKSARQVRLNVGDRRKWPLSEDMIELTHRSKGQWHFTFLTGEYAGSSGVAKRSELLDWTVEA